MRARSELPAIEVFDEVGSTNDLARERALAGAPHGSAVRARVQRAGRGQQGHRWTSPAGGLYLSVVLWPQIDPFLVSGISAVVGMAVVQTLRGLGAQSVQLKWPNDVVCGRAKLGGILAEAGLADGRGYAVCGVGINIQTPQVAEGSPGALEATGLAACLPAGSAAPSPAELAELVRAGIVDAADQWVASSQEAPGPLSSITEEYHELLAFRGEPVELVSKDGRRTVHGVFLGVDDWGRARVHVPGDWRVMYDSAEYSLRPV